MAIFPGERAPWAGGWDGVLLLHYPYAFQSELFQGKVPAKDYYFTVTQIKIVYFINSFKTGSCSSPITPPNIYTPASLLTRSFVEKYGGNEQLPWIMEKCFLDKIERRTWRSPFPEGLPSGWAEGCTGATQEHLLDRKGWLYLFNEREIKMKTSEAFLWRHSAWMEPWQLPHTFTGLQGTVSHLAQLQPVSSCKEFSTSSLDPEPSYPFPI